MELIAVSENLPVEVCADRNDDLLSVLLQSDQVPSFFLKPAHASDWIVREVAQPTVDCGGSRG